jgi:hypothetical protein
VAFSFTGHEHSAMFFCGFFEGGGKEGRVDGVPLGEDLERWLSCFGESGLWVTTSEALGLLAFTSRSYYLIAAVRSRLKLPPFLNVECPLL